MENREDLHRRIVPLGLGAEGRQPLLADLAIFILIAGGLAMLAHGAREIALPASTLQTQPITLDPASLPDYALRRFRDELEDHMAAHDADQTLRAVTSWGRYAEIFAYDEARGIFSLDDPG